MSEEELAKKIETYAEVAKENPNVDVSLLMMNALKEQTTKQKDSKGHKWAYLISIGFPPFGLLFAIKYYLSGDEDEKTAGNICVGLTVIAVLLFYAFSKMLFSGTGASLEQIQQIKPQDIMQLTE